MANCEKCGAGISEGAEFCSVCGLVIEELTANRSPSAAKNADKHRRRDSYVSSYASVARVPMWPYISVPRR